MAARHGEAAYLSCLAPAYRQDVGGGVTLMGAGANPLRHPGRIIAMIRDYDPTHLVIHGPMLRLLRASLSQGMPVACMFADSFAMGRLRRALRFFGMVGLLNDPRIALVANHGENAARGLVDLGVDAGKVMAWDFPHARHPGQFSPRLRPGGVPYELLYVGSLEKRKGVGDLIRAMGLLRERMPLRLNIIGTGRQEAFEAMVAAQNLGEHVRFLGRMANAEVFARMQQADAVVVPSRHAFPEGLPLTLYEALAARAPVIASDHPMFAGHLRHRETAMVFRSGDAQDLAAQIAALFADDDLYARLSRDGEKAWNHMQVDARWGDILDRWVHGSDEDQAWCRDNSFAARMDRVTYGS